MNDKDLPAWWPQCPWHEDVWKMTMDQLKQRIPRIIPNEDTRTSVCGVLMREGWRLCEKEFKRELIERRGSLE